MSLSVLNNFELCYRGTSFKVRGGFGNCGVFLVHNYVSEQFGNYVEYGMWNIIMKIMPNASKMYYIVLNTTVYT